MRRSRLKTFLLYFAPQFSVYTKFGIDPKILLFFATVLTKIFPLFLTIYTLAVIPILFLVWQIYKLISADSWQAIFHTTKTIYVVGYIVIFFALTRLQTALYIYANE